MLLLVQHVRENPAWLLGLASLDPAVLSALGIARIFWGICWRLPLWAIGAVCGAAVWMSRAMLPDVAESV